MNRKLNLQEVIGIENPNPPFLFYLLSLFLSVKIVEINF